MRPGIKRVMPFIVPVLLMAALWSIYRQLHGYRWHDLTAHMAQIPVASVWCALGLTLAGYLVMTAYDFLALQYVRHPLSYAKTALASFLGYTFSNNVGLSMLAGASIRYRIYSAWGLSAVEIAQVVLFCSASLWLGFLGLSGAVFLFEPLTLPQAAHLPFGTTRPLGVLFLMILAAYAALTIVSGKQIRIKEWRFSLPSWPLAAGQLLVAAADWFLAAAVLYTLLPPSAAMAFHYFMAIYLAAQLGGLISQVPGGLGVFESIILLLAPAQIPAPPVISALIVYRAVYYLLPFAMAVLMLGIEELHHRKELLAHARSAAAQAWTALFVPFLSLAVFFTGAVLLFSGALPAAPHRLSFLERLIPLPLLEISHFLGSLAGMGLLLLARGLYSRLDAAYVLTLALLGLGMAASMFKGLDYEEAAVLALVFSVLLPARRLFFRKTSLFAERLSVGWAAAVAVVIVASFWLGMFAFRHLEYAHELWWHFSLKGDAPRFMRASVGVVSLAAAYALSRLLRPAPPASKAATANELETVRAIVDQSANASAHLALLGDKRFLLNTAGTAFIMYGVSGQSWISMGDPVGPKDEWLELIWQFHRSAREHADRTVFYEVSHQSLHLYLDMGLTALKLGEEAIVPLTGFSLDGSARKGLRYTHRKLTKLGCTFEIVPSEQVDRLMGDLKTISDAWLKDKNTREKGFSLGFFDAGYVRQTPVAVVRVNGQVMAFSNIWQGADRQELTVDLMRHLPDAPNGVMEYLFMEMMLWGHAQGYQWFNLGMAPMSGMESDAAAPLWHKIGHWVARHGEHFYNFEGLRQYKEKFDPVWQPKYLVCPGGLALPRILADIGALVSGGLKGMVLK